VTFETGYPAAQVFSPPGADFICFEPMTAPTNALRSGHGLPRVPPGAAFTAVFRIAVAAD
jgi:aldose 1-epimerase